MKFEDFLTELQAFEGLTTSSRLVHNWKNHEKKLIEQILTDALISSIGKKSIIKVNGRTTNQSKGSKVESYICETIEKISDKNVNFQRLGKSGYPDSSITLTKFKNSIFSVEIKATSNWNPKDSNRRVLLSSTSKLRKLSKNLNMTRQIKHLILTCIYDDSSLIIKEIRIDYLEPSSNINLRLEASTTHKLLNSSNQSHIILP